MRVKRVMKKLFDKEQVSELLGRYSALGYSDLKKKYERFVLRDSFQKVIDMSSVKTPELLQALQSETHPASSILCHNYVLMVLEEAAEKRTAERYQKAIEGNDITELEDIFINYDPAGKFRQNYIKSNS